MTLGTSNAQANATAPRPASYWRGGVASVLASYGLVLFGVRGWPAAVLMMATFLEPTRGALGLFGVLMARFTARTFAPATLPGDAQWLGCNALLVALILALDFDPSATLLVLVAIAVVVAVLVALALKPLADRFLGRPLLSLPFVVAGWGALLAARRLNAVHPTLLLPSQEPQWIPAAVVPYLRSMGAIFLQPSAVAGTLVLLALFAWSRWAAVLSLLGFAAAWGIYGLLGGPRTDLELHLLGFNAILAALALGGVFIVLSPASLLLAGVAGALATLLGSALLGVLQPLELPVLAAPFILVTHAVLLALLHRLGGGPLQLVRGVPGRPEDALSHVLQQARRYPAAGVPLLYLPVMGKWLVTQGPNGDVTHQGLWSHAWDLEVTDDAGERWRNVGTEPHDFYAFGAPVVAPADGRVARAVGHLEDNPIGHVDTTNNWGNTLVLAHTGGVYSALSHLQQGSLLVREGEVVVRGQVLARVGNSGRSPAPHLHVQLQASPEIGAPTLAGEFLQFVRTSSRGRSYITHASPVTGDRVETLQVDDSVRRAFAFPPRTQWCWKIRGDSLPTEETWTSDIDALGQRCLRTSGATAAIYVDDAYATVLDYDGPANRLLALFALVAARVPFVTDAAIGWEDSPSVMPFLSPLQRAGVELLLPFADRGGVRTHGHIALTSEGIVLHTRLAASGTLPDRLELVLHADTGPTALRAWRDGVQILNAEVAA